MIKRADELKPGDTIMLPCAKKPDGTVAEPKRLLRVVNNTAMLVWLVSRNRTYPAWPEELLEVLT